MSVAYRFFPDVDFDHSKPIIREAAALLPGGVETLDQKGWNGFLEHYLGEGQFGPDRYNLSASKRLYYQLKPLLPRAAVRWVRKGYRQFQENGFPLNWPIEDRFVKFLNTLYKTNSKLSINNDQLSMGSSDICSLNSDILVSGRSDLCSLNSDILVSGKSDICPLTSDLNYVAEQKSKLSTINDQSLNDNCQLLIANCAFYWPSGKDFAVVLTHDVETKKGLCHVRELAKIDADHGFRSSFNFVPERYSVDAKLREELTGQGFEVGVHGLKHDGKLFFSKEIFEKRAARINHYLKEWKAVGFRSPLTHRNPEWMQSLDIEYDSSFFDTDPYETMPGGTMTIWPFMVGHFVELPYTLPQDSTLFITLGETSIDIWKRKVDWIVENHGMVLVNVHPDYIDFENKEAKGLFKSGKYPLGFYVELLQYIKDKGNYWNALPRDVARYCREL